MAETYAAEVTDVLLQVFEFRSNEAGIRGMREWMDRPHELLQGDTPRRAIGDGRAHEVRTLIETLTNEPYAGADAGAAERYRRRSAGSRARGSRST